MSWLIYKHTNLIDGKVYIGQTMQTPDERWRNGNGYKNNIYFMNAIKKYGWNNFLHEIIEKNIQTQELANEREIYWIGYYHSYVGDDFSNGYNLTKGGDNHEHLGIPLYQINMETLKIENVYPTIRDAERETGIDHSMIGRCCKKKERSITAGNYYWCYKDDYDSDWAPRKKKDKKDSPMGKAVYQIDMDSLIIINKFKSIIEAERNLDYGKASGISQCCSKKRYSEGGYFWCLADEWSEDWKPIDNANLRAVYRISKDNYRDIVQYDSIVVAAKENGINSSETISRCCKRKQIEARNYYWCYPEQYDDYWCPPDDNNRRKVICVETKEIFESIADAVIKTHGSKNIGRACRDSGLTSGGCHWCYLDKWDEAKWKAREKKIGNSRKVVCVETKEVFGSAKEAAVKYNVDNSTVGKCCKDYSKTSAGYHWCYLENINDFVVIPKKVGKHGMRRVVCIETNIIYDSLMDAMRATNIDSTSIGRTCKGIQNHAGGYHWKYIEE